CAARELPLPRPGHRAHRSGVRGECRLRPGPRRGVGRPAGGGALPARRPLLRHSAHRRTGVRIAPRRPAEDAPPRDIPTRHGIRHHNGPMTAPRILVVDDEPNIRDLLITSLRFAGYQVRAVSNGAQTISAVLEEEPDLIILDVM